MHSDRTRETLEERVATLHKKPIPQQPTQSQASSRYSMFGWNRNSQACYTDNELSFLAMIRRDFEAHFGTETAEKYFATETLHKWYGHWDCTTPTHIKLNDMDKFTLSIRPVTDKTMFPLDTFAADEAGHIANMQSLRVKDQDVRVQNDPIMVAFYILRDAFYTKIAKLEAKAESVLYLKKLENFVSNLVFKAPNFGEDRSNLIQIQESLQEATKIIENSITHRELPQLLTDTITSGKSLEFMIGNHLHRLVDQTVTDNFSSHYFDGKKCDPDASPVCKMYASKVEPGEFNHINRFYSYTGVKTVDGVTQITPVLRMEVLNGIKFNNNIDPKKYLELTAILESLRIMRQTIEDFQSIQEKIGSYKFANEFIEAAKELANNYIGLVNQSQTVLNGLMKSAEAGLKNIINSKLQTFFEINLRLLKTRAAKDEKFLDYKKYAIESMHKYQRAMENLAADFRSGEATQEIKNVMLRLSAQLKLINHFIPNLTDNGSITLPPEFVPTDVCDIAEEIQKEAETITAQWSKTIEVCPYTNKPIHTYIEYEDHTKKHIIGTIKFYNEKGLCFSEDGKTNNIYKATGIYKHLSYDAPANDNVCETIPPDLKKRVLLSAASGAIYGAFTGSANVLGYFLKWLGCSEDKVTITRHSFYYFLIFTWQAYNAYTQAIVSQSQDAIYDTLKNAAMSVGSMMALSGLSYLAGYIINLIKGKEKIEQKGWFDTISPYLSKLGLFAYGWYNQGFCESAGYTGANVLIENMIDMGGKLAFSKNNKPEDENRGCVYVAGIK